MSKKSVFYLSICSLLLVPFASALAAPEVVRPTPVYLPVTRPVSAPTPNLNNLDSLRRDFLELQNNFIKKTQAHITSLEQVLAIRQTRGPINPQVLAQLSAAKQKTAQLEIQTKQTINWLSYKQTLTATDLARLNLQLKSTKTDLALVYDLLIKVAQSLTNQH
jgi:hypothetical protein